MDLQNRELSWLAFNDRVLQEALDEKVPIVERMRFLGIYSNNMDEFWRVRVAYVRRMIAFKNNSALGFDGTPQELYDEIRNVVMKQQIKFQVAYKRILSELEEENIYHINENQLNGEQVEELKKYFNLQLKHAIVPLMLYKETPFPRLKDSGIYLAVKMIWTSKSKEQFALIKIPNAFSRFYKMNEGNKEYIILLDDIIRLNLNSIFSIFNYDSISAHTFKFTRDAELDLDLDISVSFIEKIVRSVKKRKEGIAVRFVYDPEMPEDVLSYLLKNLGMEYGVNTIPGGKYHNFKDFMSFPDFGRPEFVHPIRIANDHLDMMKKRSLIKQVIAKDILLHFPYQRFDYVVDLLRESAIDPKVKSIKINVYRVAKQSQVMNALMNAVSNGKEVTVFFELQARFDEENNVFWANKLKDAGAKVSFGIENLKVHSKLLQIYRIGSKSESLITYIGTGNFNENTARIYEDLALLTCDHEIAKEAQQVFELLEKKNVKPGFSKLLVSPYNTRSGFNALIDNEITNAKNGLPSGIKIKINNLVDSDIIRKLYEASQAGVQIQVVVRGICCLVTDDPELSANIEIRSIVGRYLEHSRFLITENAGDRLYYIGSADMMERNLDKRVEVAVPVQRKKLQVQLEEIFNILWRGNVKSRMVDGNQTNIYYRDNNPDFYSQDEMYNYYKLD
jgi:polyphosphate kinase